MHGYIIVKAGRDAVSIGVAEREAHEFYERLTALLKALRAKRAQAYADLEIGSAQAKLLRHIDRQRPTSQAELARATDIAPTLTGRALEPLVERGWVRRKRSEADRREYLVELTAAGQRARERVEAAREGLIARLGGLLDGRDLEDFERIAGKILTAFAQD